METSTSKPTVARPIQKKICMLGSFAVGKTSLVARFVHSFFSERYVTTVGVRIDKKLVQVDGSNVALVLWDLHGDDEYQRVRVSYLRGSAGYFVVADGTRRATLDQAMVLSDNVQESLGEIPFVLLLNKHDLKDEWEIHDDQLKELEEKGWTVIHTSAKSGENVEKVFHTLTQKMLAADRAKAGNKGGAGSSS